MRRTRRRLVSIAIGHLVLASGMVSPVAALNPETAPSQYVWDRWSGDVLPTRTLRTVVFGHEGYLWIPTYVGLVRFDGDRFDVYNPSEGIGVVTNGFTAAARREGAGLWLGETGGGVFRFVDDDFVSVLSSADSRINTVNVLLDDGSGGVWVGGTPGLYHLGPGDPGSVVRWFDELSETGVDGLAEGGDGSIWAATTRGLWRIEPATGAVVHPETVGEDFTALAADSAGRLWAWGESRGLVTVGPDGGSPVRRVETGISAGVAALFVDRDDCLWLGTNDSVYRLVGRTLERWPDPADGGAYSFTEDHEGGLWFTSYYEGLVRLAEGKLSVISTPEGLNNGIVHGFAETADGGMWVATSEGVNLIREGVVQPTPPQLAELDSMVVMSLENGSDGRLWVGTLRSGLWHWDGSRLTRIEDVAEPGIRRLLIDGRELWAGSFTGLLMIDEPRRRLRSNRFFDAFVLGLEKGPDGTLWVGTDGEGLYALRDAGVQRFTTDDGLPSMFVMDAHADADGKLWLATAAGVCRFAGGRFTTATADQGLVGRAFFQILDDGRDHFWMTADDGISRVPRADLEAVLDGRAERVRSVHFDRADGLRAVKMTGIAEAEMASDGRLWFSTMDGVAVVDPSRIDFNPVPPPVVIEEVVGDGESLAMIGGAVAIPVGTETIEIRSSGLSYVAPEKVRFRYRLVGFSDEWKGTGTRRTVYFTGLAPGSYRFEVTACNNDGLWNAEPASLSFVIEPRFTQTWLFYLLCAAAIFLLGLGAAMARLRALKRRELVLAALVDERTEELGAANQELARLARVDDLTEIANHRRFREFIDEEWRRCRRLAQPLSVIMVDIDHFKRFNDRYGHQSGDETLRRVAAIVKEAARRPGDLAARYGGEEFVVVLTDTEAAGARRLAEAIRSDVAAAGIAHDGSDLGHVSVSAGVATMVPRYDVEPIELVHRADDALYSAKSKGRNRVESAG